MRKPAPGGLYIIRGSCVVNRSIAEIVDYVKLIERKSEYDELFESGYVIETLNDETEIVY